MGPADRASRDGPRGATRSLVFSVDVKMMGDVAVSGSLDFLIFLERAWVIDAGRRSPTRSRQSCRPRTRLNRTLDVVFFVASRRQRALPWPCLIDRRKIQTRVQSDRITVQFS